MIRGIEISKKIGSKVILKQVNLSVPPGQFVVLLGPNGAGKSTLLKVLSLLDKPSEGRILIGGSSGERNNLALRKKIGFLSHRSLLYDRLSARENLKFYGHLYDVPRLDERIKVLAEQVGLQYFLDEPVYTFSRGMVQKLAVIRAMIHDPEILFLDEPYTGLDQQAGAIFTGLLYEWHKQGRTVFMVTHAFGQGLDLAERVVILVRGRIIYDAPFCGESHNLRDLYLNQVGRGQ
ncbi:MAG: ABC transporter ATP-binding protein [Bacillota bacterium]|jgi:heme exporter protein A|nr:ABC transporter ATP-binding protein [Clostridia bacterium]